MLADSTVAVGHRGPFVFIVDAFVPTVGLQFERKIPAANMAPTSSLSSTTMSLKVREGLLHLSLWVKDDTGPLSVHATRPRKSAATSSRLTSGQA